MGGTGAPRHDGQNWSRESCDTRCTMPRPCRRRPARPAGPVHLSRARPAGPGPRPLVAASFLCSGPSHHDLQTVHISGLRGAGGGGPDRAPPSRGAWGWSVPGSACHPLLRLRQATSRSEGAGNPRPWVLNWSTQKTTEFHLRRPDQGPCRPEERLVSCRRGWEAALSGTDVFVYHLTKAASGRPP